MHTLEEIKVSISRLSAEERAILVAELFASSGEPEAAELEQSLQRGLDDVRCNRVHSVAEVRELVDKWTGPRDSK